MPITLKSKINKNSFQKKSTQNTKLNVISLRNLQKDVGNLGEGNLGDSRTIS